VAHAVLGHIRVDAGVHPKAIYDPWIRLLCSKDGMQLWVVL
jgi:hypothetical protein